MYERGTITLPTGLDQDCVLVDVIDAGTGSSGSFAERNWDRVANHGLRIVDTVARR